MCLFFVGSGLIAYYYGYDESQTHAQLCPVQYRYRFGEPMGALAMGLFIDPPPHEAALSKYDLLLSTRLVRELWWA